MVLITCCSIYLEGTNIPVPHIALLDIDDLGQFDSLIIQNVCYQYWPTSGVQKIGEYTIDLIGEENLEGFVIRTLSVVEGKVRIVSVHSVWWRARYVWLVHTQCGGGQGTYS